MLDKEVNVKNLLRIAALFVAVPALSDGDAECADGLTLWQRGIDVAFCAAPCVADIDCMSGIERCRLIDPEAGPDDPPILIDDAPEIVEFYVAEGREVFGLCDPFFDVEGVVDDVVAAE
jgi:hypothetical protein